MKPLEMKLAPSSGRLRPMTRCRPLLSLAAAVGLSFTGCQAQTPTATPSQASAASASDSDEAAQDGAGEPATNTSASTKAPDTALGGQLYDKWFSVGSYNGGFEPDASKTEALDGAQGPNDNGTLNDGTGKALANPGHDYRIKNLFGWDLRGAEGIYGPDYQNKAYVLTTNLLTDARSQSELVEWFTKGDAKLPAFGDELSPAQIEALAAFIIAVREGELPQPDQIFALSKDAPKNYTLAPGADPSAGVRLYAQRCSGCHGTQGDSFAIDGKYSVGSFSRMNAYEGWLKVVNGHPGSPMSRQSTDAQEVLNLFAALCDRSSFVPLDAENEVPDGDLRCGAYLK